MADTAKRQTRTPPKSEVVTIRLDPKLRYMAELAARKQRRSVSSFIEWAVEQSLREVVLHQGSGYNGDENVTMADEVRTLWDVDAAERFIKLAINYPGLMTMEEQERWKMLSDSGFLNTARSRDRAGNVTWNMAVLEDDVLPLLRGYWEELLQMQSDGAGQTWVNNIRGHFQAGTMKLAPSVKPKPASGFDDMEDDIPF